LALKLVQVLLFHFILPQSNFPAFQNAISGVDLSKNANRKYEILETQASSNILPPQFDNNELDPTLIPASEDFPIMDKSNERRREAFAAPQTGFEPPRLLPNHNDQIRAREEARLNQLGLQSQTQRAAAAPFAQQQTAKPVGAKTFDPDKNFKAFESLLQPGKKATHKDYDFSRYFTKKEGSEATAAPFVRRPVVTTTTTTTTRRPVVNFNQQTTTRRAAAPTTRSIPTNKPFVQTNKPFAQTTTTTRRAVPTTTRTTTQKPRVQPAFNQNVNQQQNNQFQRPTSPTLAPRVQPQVANRINVPSKKTVPELSRDILPPLDAERNHEDGSTQGPPIYFEWKIPASGLQPPKLENETESQSKRSVLEEGNAGNSDIQSSESRRLSNQKKLFSFPYKDLQKALSIPEYEFPIETDGRVGYENAEAVNSFQIKIPYKKDSKDAQKSEGSDRYYYLEHAHCNPECHPYFFKPGRCEPCVKL